MVVVTSRCPSSSWTVRDIVAVLEQVRRERVPQGVGARALGESDVSDRGLDCALQNRLV